MALPPNTAAPPIAGTPVKAAATPSMGGQAIKPPTGLAPPRPRNTSGMTAKPTTGGPAYTPTPTQQPSYTVSPGGAAVKPAGQAAYNYGAAQTPVVSPGRPTYNVATRSMQPAGVGVGVGRQNPTLTLPPAARAAYDQRVQQASMNPTQASTRPQRATYNVATRSMAPAVARPTAVPTPRPLPPANRR